MTRARPAASWTLSAFSAIAARPSAPVNSSGAIAAVAPERSAIPPAAHLLTAAVPVNASSPKNPATGLARMREVNVRMAPPDAVMTASAAIGPRSARRSAAVVPGPAPPAAAGHGRP